MRILIAEDSAVARLMLQAGVEELGHECLVSADGAEAWARYQAEGADVIISDWVMPGLEGPELCRLVRSQASSAYTYFIFLTKLEELQHVLAGMQAGADDYLTKPLDLEQLRVRLIAARRVTALHRQLAEQRAELNRLNEALATSARTDSLTQLGNRLKLQEDLDILRHRANRYGYSVAIALCDVDYFKRYNDQYGHLAGDQVLATLGRLIRQNLRGGDAAYRYGGEEFLLLYPDQSLASAGVAVERLRGALEGLAIPHAGNPAGVVTLSGGLAVSRPTPSTDWSDLLRRADEALYRAKSDGRNRVQAERSEARSATRTDSPRSKPASPSASASAQR